MGALGELFVLPEEGDCLFGVCSSNNAIKSISSWLGLNSREPNEKIIELAKKKLGTDSEKVVLKAVLSYDDYMREKKNFKVDAPMTDEPLNDKQVDDVMYQFAAGFDDFYAYEFCMYNISAEPGASLNQISPVELYKKGFRRWGCIINTDVYGGGGIHWVCLYGDMTSATEWTIEYFNSSSRKPYGDIEAWIKRTEMEMIAFLREQGQSKTPVTIVTAPIDYQKGEGNVCGVYCLIYIWQRLNEVPYDKYLRKKISNGHVLAFKKYMFSSKAMIEGGRDKTRKPRIGIN